MELGEYVEAFRANKIDGELLSELEDRDLIQVCQCCVRARRGVRRACVRACMRACVRAQNNGEPITHELSCSRSSSSNMKRVRSSHPAATGETSCNMTRC